MYEGERKQRRFADAFWTDYKPDPNDILVKISDAFPWQEVLEALSKFYSSYRGRPTKPTRLQVGLLIVKHIYQLGDENTVKMLRQNLCVQYLCDIAPQDTISFHPTNLVKFRKQIGIEGVKVIEEAVENQLKKNKKTRGNTMIVDSTIVPENIQYPTDINLLEKARRNLIKVIDNVSQELNINKPRTYRRVARKTFLSFIKFRKQSTKQRIKIQKKLIRFVDRNLKQANNLIQKSRLVTDKVKDKIKVISQILDQQKILSNGNNIKDRIVSIEKPEARPMLKGKYPTSVEFGPKITLVKKGNGIFLADLDNNTSDHQILDKSISFYTKNFEKVPNAVVADRGYYDKQKIVKLKES